MEVRFTDEQARIVARFMKLQADHTKRQMAELRAQAKAADSLARKVFAGTVDLDECEIRSLKTIISSIDVIKRMSPELLNEEAVAQLKELSPLLANTKRGFGC